jgi:hypothetical protein
MFLRIAKDVTSALNCAYVIAIKTIVLNFQAIKQQVFTILLHHHFGAEFIASGHVLENNEGKEAYQE